MSITNIDDLFASGAPGFFNKDTPVGASITGTVVTLTAIQSSDYATKAPETWDDGRPKMLLALTIESNIRATQDDNGHRTIYIKTWGSQADAFKRAVQAAGGPTATVSQIVTPGARFTATYSGTEPSKFGSDTKLYTYQVQPGAAAVDNAFAQQPEPVQQPTQTPGFGQGQPPAWATQPPAQQAPQAAYQAPAPVQQPITQTPQPVATPAQQAPVAPAAEPTDQAAQARQLIALGLDDEQIAGHTGLDPAVVTMLRNQAA